MSFDLTEVLKMGSVFIAGVVAWLNIRRMLQKAHAEQVEWRTSVNHKLDALRDAQEKDSKRWCKNWDQHDLINQRIANIEGKLGND